MIIMKAAVGVAPYYHRVIELRALEKGLDAGKLTAGRGAPGGIGWARKSAVAGVGSCKRAVIMAVPVPR